MILLFIPCLVPLQIIPNQAGRGGTNYEVSVMKGWEIEGLGGALEICSY